MKKEYLLAGTSILLWASAAALTKLLLNDLDSMQVSLFSSGFAFLFMLVLNLVTGNLKVWRYYKIRDYLLMAFMGFIGIFLYYLFLYLAMDSMLAQQAFIINYLWPIATVVFACILLKEKMTLRKGIALVLSFIGVMIVATNGSLSNLRNGNLKGVLFAVLAAVLFGLYSALNKKKGFNKQFSIMIFFFVAFLISLIYILVKKDFPRLNFLQLAGFAWNGIFVYGVAQTTWFIALEKGNTSKISNLAYLTPFISLIYIYFILHEMISVYSVVGLVVIIAGILLQMNDRRPAPEKILEKEQQGPNAK